jgi:hypothetical protein
VFGIIGFNSYPFAVCEVGFHWIIIEKIVKKFLQGQGCITIAALPL